MLQKNYYKLKIIVFTGISKSFFFYTSIELILWVQFQKPDTILYLQHFFILQCTVFRHLFKTKII